MKKLATWLAIGAMALQALWPLVAQARPTVLVPICAAGGVTHYIELPGGDAPSGAPAAKHCPFCIVGSPPVIASAPAAPFPAPAEAATVEQRGVAASFDAREFPARPRAPPLPR